MYGTEEKLISIIFSLMMLLLAYVIRSIAGTILVPAGIFALTWFFCTLAPLVLLIDVPINSLAILYIFSAALSFSLSLIAFNWQEAFDRNLTQPLSVTKFDSRFLEIIIYASAIISVSLSLLMLLINGFTFEQVIFDLIKTSGIYATVRSTEGLEYGLIGVFGTMFTYLGPLLGGLRIFSPRYIWFFVVAITPSLLTMVTQSTKLVFLVSVCFYFSGVLVAKIYAQEFNMPKKSTLIKLTIGVVILSPLVLISFISRFDEFDFNNISAVAGPLLYAIASYSMGQIYAFSDFFSFAVDLPSESTYKNDFGAYGAFTFASIFNMFGIGKDFPPGMYEESLGYNDIFETNIFTFFRGLIYDFGVFGSLIFMFIFGIFSNIVMWNILIRRHVFLSISILVSIIVFILMGYIFSVFVARYVFLVACATWVILMMDEYIYSGRHAILSDEKKSS